MTNKIELKNILNENILLITFGKGKTEGLKKAKIRKIITNSTLSFQMEKIIYNKAYHTNIEKTELFDYFIEYMEKEFKNAVIYCKEADYYIRKMKKGNLSIMKRDATKSNICPTGHNEIKNYLVPEGMPVPFLEELGIMNSEGQVSKKYYAKFRQINRFLELVNEEYSMFADRAEVKVYDLCCGKGYLTLALHYYFNKIKKKNTEILGMDLKKDVIESLNGIVKKLNLSGIEFKYGDIKNAELVTPDLVVALHACDIATDIALTSAVSAGTKLIMAVPCCQHELFNQIKNKQLAPILKYGIMKDKFTELSTNALRGLALEAQGYDVRMIEFTSLEHTMKNIMIKAISGVNKNKNAYDEFYKFSKNLNVDGSSKWIINAAKKAD